MSVSLTAEVSSRPDGLSLIELLAVIAIIAVLVTATPGLSSVIERTRTQQAIEVIRSLGSLARAEAVTRGTPVTLCGTLDGATCTKLWDGADVLVFVDHDQDDAYNASADVLIRYQALPYRIVWQGSNSHYMRFHPGGYLSRWGRYTYCPDSGKAAHARQLVFNRLGRSYETTSGTEPCKAAGWL